MRRLIPCTLLMMFAFTILAPSANAGLFARARARRAAACNQQTAGFTYQQSYQTYAAAPCAPCGQANCNSPCAQGQAPCGSAPCGQVGYSYQYQAAAPCAPCGQTAAPLPVYSPATAVPNSPALNSTPINSYQSFATPARPPQVTCQDGKCYLRR